jgi:hypothetical protein
MSIAGDTRKHHHDDNDRHNQGDEGNWQKDSSHSRYTILDDRDLYARILVARRRPLRQKAMTKIERIRLTQYAAKSG